MFGFFFVAFVAVFGIVFFISYKLLEDREDTDSDWSSSQSPEPDYFQQTQTAPWELKYNKGKQGEYQLGQVLNQLYGYKKILYNLYIYLRGFFQVLLFEQKNQCFFQLKMPLTPILLLPIP